MDYKLLLFVGLCGFPLIQSEDAACGSGYWGDGCINYCGYCAVITSDGVQPEPYNNRQCDPSTGNCDSGCQAGYTGDRCDEPICTHCTDGACVAPELCQLCKDISHVSPNCVNIKFRGLMGSLMAFIVLISSITACGVGAVFYNKKKPTPNYMSSRNKK